jgi:FAD/FMN-containing dehydrogenase
VFDEIYRFILPKGLDIVGGGGSVGIGGWMTGGGFSLKTSEHGLGIDNLVEAEIVLPKGEKVRANNRQNVDLFWAIKVCSWLDLQVRIERLTVMI